MKKFRFCGLVLALLLAGCGGGVDYGTDVRYVASKQREPYHETSCEWAGRIDGSNLQRFRTEQEAVEAGHRPCKVCRP